MGGPGSGRKPIFDDEYHRIHRQLVADSRKRAKEREETQYITPEEEHRQQTKEINECIVIRMKGLGEDFDTAYAECEAKLAKIESPMEEVDTKYPQGTPSKESPYEPTPLERCANNRVDLYGETEEQALATCQRMFTEPLIKRKTGLAAEEIFEAGDPSTMADAFRFWDQKHSQAPYWVEWRKQKDLRFKFDMMNARIKRGTATDTDREIQKRMNRLYWDKHIFMEYDQWLRAKQEYERELGDMRRERDRKALLTVGDLKGKTKAQIIRLDAQDVKRKHLLTVGSLYMRDQDEEAERKRFEDCVQEYMSERGMTREEAEHHCKRPEKEIPET